MSKVIERKKDDLIAVATVTHDINPMTFQFIVPRKYFEHLRS